MRSYGILSLVFVLIVRTASVRIGITTPQTLWKDDPILALSGVQAAKVWTAYSTLKRIEGGSPSTEVSLSSQDQVTAIAEDDVVGKVSVNYIAKCLTLTRPDGSTKSIGLCTGKVENVTSIDITPYGVTFGKNREIAFTDTYKHAVRIWNPDSNVVTTLVNDVNLVRPRGIAYDSSNDGYYVTISNGVYSTKDRSVIAGLADENTAGMKDGSLSQARFNHPIGIVLLRPGKFAVADHSNSRVRVVDVVRKEVYSLCSISSDVVTCSFNSYPISLSVDKNLDNLFIGTAKGLLRVDLIPPTNLCYGIDQSGAETITIKGKSMQVWCDMDTPKGPWITLMKRYDGSQDFNQKYADYTKGFGTVSAEHWLGLENIHLLTENNMAELRIDVEGFRPPIGKPINGYAHYTKFRVGDAASGYMLEEITGYSGTAGDMESTAANLNLGGPHKGQQFSAPDKDEDSHNSNCAAEYNGGWWFRQCFTACLTCGPYTDPPRRGYGTAMIYFPYTRTKIGLKSGSMKIKLPQALIWDN